MSEIGVLLKLSAYSIDLMSWTGHEGPPNPNALENMSLSIWLKLKIVYHIGNSIWNRDQLKLPQINTYYYTILIDYKKISHARIHGSRFS